VRLRRDGSRPETIAPQIDLMNADQNGATARRPLRVLLVEDSESDALLLVRALQRAGFEPSMREWTPPVTWHPLLSRPNGFDSGRPRHATIQRA